MRGMTRNEIKNELRERIIDLRQQAKMWDGRPDRDAFKREIYGLEQRALEAERTLNLMSR